MSSSVGTITDKTIECNLDASRYRRILVTVVALVVGYLAFSVWMFDLPSVARKWSPERATMFMLDTYAHSSMEAVLRAFGWQRSWVQRIPRILA